MLIVAAVRNTIKKCLQNSRGWVGAGEEGKAQRLLGRRFVSSGLRAPLSERSIMRWPGREGSAEEKDGEVSCLDCVLMPECKTSPPSLYNIELFTIEISQSTVLSEKISESQ